MDALSVLLQNVHLFETKYYRLNGTGNWSYSITRKDTILFYLVMSGRVLHRCWKWSTRSSRW